MDNKTIMQYFEWYLPSDGLLWRKAASQAEELSQVGITDVWLPPAYKGASGAKSVGYDVYDLYDLGEFDQKGSVRTKYGTKEEYLEAVRALHSAGVRVMADTVLNQMMGADETEKVEAIDTASYDREQEISNLHEIEAWTKFTFPGRKGKYSDRIWTAENFSGTDLDQATGSKSVYLFRGKKWNDETDSENVNYDYLMGVDLDFDNPDTCQALIDWGKWYFETVQPDALRLDAVKHISFESYREWLKLIRRETGKDFFAVGEYWSGDLSKLLHYINVVVDGQPSRSPEKKADPEEGIGQEDADAESGAEASQEVQPDEASENEQSQDELPRKAPTPKMDLSADSEISKEALKIAAVGSSAEDVRPAGKRVRGTQIALFDVPLHFAFLNAATSNGNYDMRNLFEGTLVQARPECAVTFIDNHDTQPGQALESYIPE
ncbi:MAG: alpha-amylase, partial [Lachnospiraceae bacterium]|nr:alpha-amylase [Lachnospiraceae bacterium]